MVPAPLQQLIQSLAKLPGLGPRSAQKAALYLIKNPEKGTQIQHLLAQVNAELQTCTCCGNIALEPMCDICQNVNGKRDETTLCVVEQVDDIWALERSGTYRGLYHVLGGVVSALDGIGPDKLTINQLVQRVSGTAEHPSQIQEVVLALNAGVDGQTTGHLIAQKLKHTNATITSLAMGIPVGASVDYLDDGTLTFALKNRQSVR